MRRCSSLVSSIYEFLDDADADAALEASPLDEQGHVFTQPRPRLNPGAVAGALAFEPGFPEQALEYQGRGDPRLLTPLGLGGGNGRSDVGFGQVLLADRACRALAVAGPPRSGSGVEVNE